MFYRKFVRMERSTLEIQSAVSTLESRRQNKLHWRTCGQRVKESNSDLVRGAIKHISIEMGK